ncbi:ABC transporter substrate-binding protein [Bradyrhizobium neotropicale]|uniref:ABC transporter substrate-binding protein n=1 Tax=Bradyrhizobium neotropicale TaxID=1497615 RepID=UPI001AD78A02|nr:ABC transporter substrate-binding protein [Bradyrhizobium neotropicale]MBO4228205.1 ABC transporter substrate-binding protein [Bradyrhizobium neotropicale]
MKSMRMVAALVAIVLPSGHAVAQDKVTIAIGGSSCLCYLPAVLAQQLGEYDRAGVSVDMVDLRGGSDTLTAVLSGSADVVTGYFDHCVELAARKQALQSFVVFDRYPGEVVVVSPAHSAEIKSLSDLAGKKVGVTAPGSTSDFFLKFLLKKSGVDPATVSVIGIGVGATAVAAMEQGQIDAAVMLDPSVTYLQGKHSDLRVLADTRSERDAGAVFGADYPGGALYSTAAWIGSHQKEAQALTDAIVRTLAWIHSHSPEEIMAKMPSDLIGKDRELYLAALKNTIPMFSETGRMDPKGAEVVLSVFSESSPTVAQARIDVSKTYTNRFVDHAGVVGAPATK